MEEISRFESVYRKEKKGLLAFLKSRISDIPEAEDILQDIFLNTLKRADVLEAVENLSGWLYTAARNRIIDYYRARTRKNRLYVDIQSESEESVSLEEIIRDSGIDVERDFLCKLVNEEIIEALEDLPEAQRDVFILHAVDGICFRDISELTGIPVNTLISRKRYAVLHLRERLKFLSTLVRNN